MSWLHLVLQDLNPSDGSRAETEQYNSALFVAPDLQPQWLGATETTCNKLILGLPGAGSYFLKCVMSGLDQKQQQIAQMVLPKVTLQQFAAVPSEDDAAQKPSSVDEEAPLSDPTLNYAHQIPVVELLLDGERIIVVDVPEKVHAVRAPAWTRTLLQHIKPDLVIVLDSMLIANYHSDSREDIIVPVLRKLSTSRAAQAQSSLKIAHLEVPNVLSGLGASIMTHCEMYGIPAEVYISLEETHALEVESVRAFEPVWKHVAEKAVQVSKPVNFAQVFRKFKPRGQNPLYL